MIIEISDDVVDEIVQQTLLQDYVNLTADLKRAKTMHEDDIAAFTETVQAIEILSKWYFVHGEFQKAVKKARKAK